MKLSYLRAGVLATLLAVSLTACGGGSSGDDPTSSPTPAPTTAAPSPTAAPTTAAPLSRFEGQPPVKVLRAWAAAAAKDINARSHGLARARAYELPSGYTDFNYTVRKEFDKYYPGPFPFTPVAVTRHGRTAQITTCLWAEGFALKHKGGPRAEKHGVVGALFTARKVGGAWKLADIAAATVDCSGVTIKGVTW